MDGRSEDGGVAGSGPRGPAGSARPLPAALDELADDQRRAWLLREVTDLSDAEIAEEMTTSASTVRGLLSRAPSSITIRMGDWR